MKARAVLVAFALALQGCQPATDKAVTIEKANGAMPNRSAPTQSSAASAPAPEHGHVKLLGATDDGDALTLIRTRRLEAKAEGRVLVVYIGATWCEPCKRFGAELASGRLDERLSKVTLLAFDIDNDGDRLAAAGYRTSFVPFVALPAADGQPADSVRAEGKGGDAWRELLARLDAWQRRAGDARQVVTPFGAK